MNTNLNSLAATASDSLALARQAYVNGKMTLAQGKELAKSKGYTLNKKDGEYIARLINDPNANSKDGVNCTIFADTLIDCINAVLLDSF